MADFLKLGAERPPPGEKARRTGAALVIFPPLGSVTATIDPEISNIGRGGTIQIPPTVNQPLGGQLSVA